MNDNPYAPPKAVVADPVIDPAARSRPREVTLAARLLWVALALGAFNAVVDSARLASSGSVPPYFLVGSVAGSLLVLCVLAWLTNRIAHGRNWARIVFLVMFVIGIPIFLLQLPVMFASSVFATAVSATISVLQMIALYLVFLGAGSYWFSRREEHT